MANNYWQVTDWMECGPYKFKREARGVVGETQPRVVNWSRNRLTEEGLTPHNFQMFGLEGDAAALAEALFQRRKADAP